MNSMNIWSEFSERLSGGWKCISFELFEGSGTDKRVLLRPHGDNPLARLYLSPKGWIAVHTANPRHSLKPLPSGKAWPAGDDNEVANVARGLTMWCGYLQLFRNEINELYWEAHVEVSCDPGKIGKVEARKLEYYRKGDADYMALTTLQPLNLGGETGLATLTWVRFE